MQTVEARIARLGIARQTDPFHETAKALAKASAMLDQFDAKIAEFERHMETVRRLAP